MSRREANKRILDGTHTPKPYVQTAYASIDCGQGDKPPDDAFDQAEDFWALFHALCFLQQRDLFAYGCSFHHTPDCIDEPVSKHWYATRAEVPSGTKIQIFPMYAKDSVVDLATLWASPEKLEKTGFARAWMWSLASMGDHELANSYIKQWISFEILFNRWTDVAENAPKEVRIQPRSVVRKKIQPAIRAALQPLVSQGELTSEQAQTLVRSVRDVIRPRAVEKAHAFLKAHALSGVPDSWVEESVRTRNAIMHGQVSGATHQELHWRTLSLRELVNRYIMLLAGYEAPDWEIEGHSDFYRRIDSAGVASRPSPP
jgi:hypothetical protein